MARTLEGKVAFITGAARGQGRAEAVKLAREGADIIALDLAGPLPHIPYESATEDDLRETVRLVEAEGRRIVAEKGDVRDLDTQKAVVKRGVDELGRLDIVVANAAVSIFEPWDEVTPETFSYTMDVNVVGVWNTVMAAAPHLIEAGGGSVILISSYAGKKLQPYMIHYTASKHAVTGLTRSFAAELGQHNIRVNSVHPGGVRTPMGFGVIKELKRTAHINPKLNHMGTPFLPDGLMRPEDIAETVAFLASDAARYITSEHISVDAGSQYF